jgi:hypothetical protein
VVEALGEQIPNGPAELLVGEGIRVIRLGNVPVEIQIGSLDPGRPAEPEARFLDFLAESRKRLHPLSHPIAEAVDGERAPVGARRDDQELAGVAFDHARLQAQDLRIVLAEPFSDGAAHTLMIAPAGVVVMLVFRVEGWVTAWGATKETI